MHRLELMAFTPWEHRGWAALDVWNLSDRAVGNHKQLKSQATSVKAGRTQHFQFGVKFVLCVSPSCLGEKGEGTLLVPRCPLFWGLPTLCTLWVFHGSSLSAHWGGAKFCSAVHIQGSMLMRIIIKRCRVGTRLLQSALRQKQKGQRQS